MSLFYSNPHCGYGGQCFLFDSVQVRCHSDLSKLFILWRIFPPAIFAAFMPSLFGRFCHLILYIFRLFSLDFSPIIFSYSCNLLGEIILGSCHTIKSAPPGHAVPICVYVFLTTNCTICQKRSVS